MQTFSLTDTGRMRTANQDYVFCQDTEIGSFPNLFIVADGMGGHNAGDTASRMCVEEIVSQIQKSTKITPIGIFEQAVAAANEKVYQASKEDPSLYGMGTTVVAAMVLGKTVYVVNVGDSRLYVCKESLTQVTVDHSLVEEMVRLGEMDKEDAKVHPDKNIITRAIGVLPEVSADFFETVLVPGDTVLLCSDGLTNMVDDTDIKRIVLGQRDIVEKTQRLIDAANENGGKDNITVVLIEPFSDETR